MVSALESNDQIRVDLGYVLVRIGTYFTHDGNTQPQDVIYSPHDVSLEDNVLAVVSEYGLAMGPFWKFGSLGAGVGR